MTVYQTQIYSAGDSGTEEALTTWDHWMAAHPAGNLLQTYRWGVLKADFGWDWELVTLQEDGDLQAGALVLYRDLPLRVGKLAYVPRGPVVAWDDEGLATALLEQVEAAARQQHAWAVWLEPEAHPGSPAEALLQRLAYHPSEQTIQPASTILVDLQAPEEEILARMKSKTRYNIRLAGRKGVTVRAGGLEDLPRFHDLMEVTGDRDEFGIHSREYYRRMLELYLPAGQVTMLLAEAEGKTLAALLAFAVGEKSWYISGASSNELRNYMPTYALQWAAMQWAKERGCSLYDLWGIPHASEEELEAQFLERSDGLWGVYRFKRGFGGEVVHYVGLWEKALHPLYKLGAKLYTARMA